MNNTCPSCGALYNVASKDIGRKIKCKKCSTSLMVTEAGLVVDTGGSAPAPAVAPAAAPAPARDKDRDRDRDRDREPAGLDDDDEPVVKKKKGKYERQPGAGIDILALIPTAIFAFGVFLVVVFTSLPVIGRAGTDRADANVERLELDRDKEIKKLTKGKKQADLTPDDMKRIAEESQKIREKYEPMIIDAGMDAKATSIANRRDVWMERYGLMFGFIFVAFGCIGFLKLDNPLVMRIAATVILCFMMMVMFMAFGGCDGPPIRPPIKG